MSKIDKILAAIEIIITAAFVFMSLSVQGFTADNIAGVFGAFLGVALIPFLIAIIASRISKKENKRAYQWKIFVRTYIFFLILMILGVINQS